MTRSPSWRYALAGMAVLLIWAALLITAFQIGAS